MDTSNTMLPGRATIALAQEPSSPTRSAGRPHAEVMAELKATLAGIAAIAPPSQPVVYLDYPMHPNVGDLLIHLGTERFLKDYGYKVLGRYSIYDFCLTHRKDRPLVFFKDSVRHLDRLVSRGATILLHGGGNLGDLYPNHQAFREIVIQRYPDAKIVMLPQSAHWGSPASRDRTAKILGAHQNLFAFARDRESLGYLSDECRVPAALMPDMAHQLWNSGVLRTPDRAIKGRVLHLRRQDQERPGEPAVSGADTNGASSIDWEDLITSADWFVVRSLAKLQTLDMPPRGLSSGHHAAWYAFRDRIVRRALKLFDGVEGVVTDRLHGVIFSALLGKPVAFIDNSYGKLSRYHSLWLAHSDSIWPLG